MHTTNVRLTRWLAPLAAAVVLGIATPARAQLPPVVINYSFSVPIAKVAPNPCTAGKFVLITGTQFVSVKTTSGTPFKLEITLTSEGTGQDALANGTIISNGTQGPTYRYTSSAIADASFLGGTPTLFKTSFPIVDYLIRETSTTADDSFTLTADLTLVVTNGIPTAPVLNGIDASCK
jgi:hypothetical protein